jgi:hypothetical protein
MEFFNWLHSRRGLDPVAHSIRLNDDGVALISSGPRGKEKFRMKWEDIKKVLAYKKDGFAFDQIRILLGNDEEPQYIEVTEHMDGFEALVNELPIRFPGCPQFKEWYEDVALPPFETKWMQIYP